MGNRSPTFRARVRGDLACFTRPEFKVERMSYEVMTPSAARGILEAILWKPAMRWVVDCIRILAPIRFASFRRNEVNDRVSVVKVGRWMKGATPQPYFADSTDKPKNRAQRNTVALRDVDYVIEAHFVLTDGAGPDDNVPKFVDMFERRLAKGQSFHQPYLGCREFPARVEAFDDPDAPAVPEELRGRKQLGWMLHDIDFGPPATPRFFDAVMVDGVIEVPEFDAAKEVASCS